MDALSAAARALSNFQHLYESTSPLKANTEARVRKFTTTNEALPYVDALPLQKALDTSRETLNALEEVVITVQDALEKLKALRPSLEESISNLSLRIVLHPIRSIPDEMLSEVFGWCMPQVYDSTLESFTSLQGDSLAPGLPPWTLSQVSRRWRAISLSCPRLWSVVDLPFHSYREIPHMKIIFRLLLQLKRQKRVAGKFWRHHCRPKICRAFRDATSALNFELGDSSAIIDTFQHAHSLSYVKRDLGRDVDVVFPTHQLRSYATRGHGVDLLPRLTALEKLHIRCTRHLLEPCLSSISPSSPLTFSSLQSIILEDCSAKTGIGFVRFLSERINAPGLVRLNVHFRGVVQPPVLYHPDVLTHLQIHHEDIGNSMTDPDTMLSFLRRTRNLEVFNFLVETAGLELVQALRVDVSASQGDILLPKLRSLNLDMQTLKYEYSDVVDMAGRRRMRHSEKDDVAQCTIWIPQKGRKLYENEWETFKTRAEAESLMALEVSVESSPLFVFE